jgi:hypothetical protein
MQCGGKEMKKHILDSSCEICGHTESHDETVCDVCGNQLSCHGYNAREIGSPFPLELIIYNSQYNFCNYTCLFKFIAAENAKETK